MPGRKVKTNSNDERRLFVSLLWSIVHSVKVSLNYMCHYALDTAVDSIVRQARLPMFGTAIDEATTDDHEHSQLRRPAIGRRYHLLFKC